jgi:integrase
MEKNAIESARAFIESLGSSTADDGYLVPLNSQKSGTLATSSAIENGHMVPIRKKPGRRAFLDGNFVRRKLRLLPHEYCIWDTDLPGFGLRVRPTGRTYWCVRLRHRGKHRRVSLGCTDDVDSTVARAQARRLLAEVALDGLPKRAVAKATPTMTDFVATYWQDIARTWKASTADRNLQAWRTDLVASFGDIRVADVTRPDVVLWRDSCAGLREGSYNRAIPVLGSLLKYAEQLHLRRRGSNPCRGLPRYKRDRMERYLSPLEYRRIAAALREDEPNFPIHVAIVRVLLSTGARLSEIRDLRWDWVKPPRLMLPDSKTGAKVIWLNSQALAVIDAQPRIEGCPFVFPNKSCTASQMLDPWWATFRRKCALPDVRIHDLRHSFASSAIMDNVPLATIGKLLGHQLTETTAKYAHLSDDVIADAAMRISGSLAGAIGLRP